MCLEIVIIQKMDSNLGLKFIMEINTLIKTECGLKKYEVLKGQSGYINKLRFYWFVAVASLRDLPKKKKD